MAKDEFCIMPKSVFYETTRREGLHRHEVFYGSLYRRKSIKCGLVVFLPPELHNGSNEGVHFNKKYDLTLKQIGQKAAMAYYGWTVEEFIREFGKNYL